MSDNEKLTDEELLKSINALSALLESEEEAPLAKALDDAEGGLTDENGRLSDKAKGKKGDDDDDDEDDDDAEKSDRSSFHKSIAHAFADEEPLADEVRSNELVKSLVLGQIEGLDIVADRLEKAMTREIGKQVASNTATTKLIKSLAATVVTLSKSHADMKAQFDILANTPARRTTKTADAVLNKSLDDKGESKLSKAQVGDALVRLVMTDKVHPMQVARYESTGELSPELTALVQGELNSSAQK